MAWLGLRAVAILSLKRSYTALSRAVRLRVNKDVKQDKINLVTLTLLKPIHSANGSKRRGIKVISDNNKPHLTQNLLETQIDFSPLS